MKIGTQTIEIRPFVLATVLWAVLGGAGSFIFGGKWGGGANLQNFILFFFLAVTNLFFILKTVAAALVLMSDQDAKNRTAYTIQVFLFGSLKFLCLGIIGLCLWKVPNQMGAGSLFGLSTLVAVPLLGGFLWSRASS
jgi:hypothetical protein